MIWTSSVFATIGWDLTGRRGAVSCYRTARAKPSACGAWARYPDVLHVAAGKPPFAVCVVFTTPSIVIWQVTAEPNSDA